MSAIPSLAKRAAAQFVDSLAFFTCLVPARMYSGSGLSACLPWFAPAGLFVGLVCTAAAALFHAFLCGRADPALAALAAAFVWFACEVAVSRALHWDGLADLADATGSGRQGEEFWRVMKDSRIGALGAMAIVTVALGQVACVAVLVDQGHWALGVLACAWGRGMAVLPLCLVPAHNANSLGGKMARGKSPAIVALSLAFALAMLAAAGAFGATAQGVLALALLQAALLALVGRTARRQGGFSGDFAGAVIELSQLLFLLACL